MKKFVEPFVYASVSAYVYFWLLPSIGSNIQAQCYRERNCSRLLQQHNFLSRGYLIDLSDNQYREFRGSVVLVAFVMTLSCLLQKLVGIIYRRTVIGQYVTYQSCMNCYHSLFGLVFLYIQHKWHAAIVLSIIILGFAVARISVYFAYPELIVWAYSLLVMLFKECHRFRTLRKFPVSIYLKMKLRVFTLYIPTLTNIQNRLSMRCLIKTGTGVCMVGSLQLTSLVSATFIMLIRLIDTHNFNSSRFFC